MSDKTKIPTKSRELVYKRDEGRCVRCSMTPSVKQWHHRRGRSVSDEHQHAPCNGVLMCPPCHAWVHKNPFEARGKGWIVARHLTPCKVPAEIFGVMCYLGHATPNARPSPKGIE